MDGIMSPIAKLEIDEYNEMFQYNCCELSNDQNGNITDMCEYDYLDKYKQLSLQSSLENLVNNFDNVISEYFTCEERLDSWSPISEKYRSCNSLVNKNQLWLSLTGSGAKGFNLDFYEFVSVKEFEHVLTMSSENDLINHNLDLPIKGSVFSGINHDYSAHSSIPSDNEPLETAEEVIEEIDKMMGISNDESSNCDVPSSLDCSEFIESQEGIQLGRRILSRPYDWINDLEKMSMKELNGVLDELDLSIREFSCLLVDELAEREELEYEIEQRQLFVNLLCECEHQQRQKQEESKLKKRSGMFLGKGTILKRWNSWRSFFSQARRPCGTLKTKQPIDRTMVSSDNISRSTKVSIPIHTGVTLDRKLLEIFNQMLPEMFVHPLHFNQLLADYILNVYAPADDVSLCMSLEIL